jgi:hypothetical protein
MNPQPGQNSELNIASIQQQVYDYTIDIRRQPLSELIKHCRLRADYASLPAYGEQCLFREVSELLTWHE